MIIDTTSRRALFTGATILFALGFVAAPAAFGQNNTDASGEFTNPGIWSQGAVPAIGDGFGGNNQTNIEADHTVTLTGGITGVDSTLDVARGGSNGSTGIFRITGGTFLAAGNVASGVNEVGANGSRTGIFEIQGGLASFNARNVHFASGAGNIGVLTQSGGTFLSTNQVRFGNNGTANADISSGFFEIRDDTDTADDMLLSQNAAARSVVTLRGDADVNVGDDVIISIRAGAVGSLTITDNATVSTDQLFVGSGAGATTNEAAAAGRTTGVVTITGGSTHHRNAGASIIIGNQDDTSGTYNISDGRVTTNGDILVANIGVVSFHTTATQTRFDTAFGASQGFYNQSGGTVDVGAGDGNPNDADDFIAGQRGTATLDISGGQLNIDRDFILGQLADSIGTDTGGAGNGTGIATIRGTADVNVGRNLVLGNNAGENGATLGTLNVDGDATLDVAGEVNVGFGVASVAALNVMGTGSPIVTVDGNINIGPNPGSSGRVNISGSNTVHVKTNVVIGSVTNADARLIQTGGVLLVDGELTTLLIEDAGGTAEGYVFSGGTLSRSNNGNLQITGDLVITGEATVIATGGTLNGFDDGVDPFSGFPDTTIDGVQINISEGFRSVDTDGIDGNFKGGGAFDFLNIPLIPVFNGTTTQVGIFWFATITGANGNDGGDTLTGASSAFLDEIDLLNIANLDASFERLTESAFESMTFSATEEEKSFIALINGDGIGGFTPRTGQNLGLAWFVRIPEPTSALLLLLSGTLFLSHRHR